MFGIKNRRLYGLLLTLFLLTLSPISLSANFETVAIMTFAQTDAAKKFERHSLNHLETILLDSGITVLDKDKAEELKNGWGALEDPSALITAEDFLANAEKYAIDGIIRIYLSLDTNPSIGGTYSATAHAELRFVGENAQVEGVTTSPMGIRGNPPSDGLSANAAGINAVYRAVEESAEKFGLEVLGKTQPRAFKFKATPVESAPNFDQVSKAIPTNRHEGLIELFDATWKHEKVSCATESQDGNMAAAGGYVTETSSGMSRTWYARLHVVDINNKVVPYVFDTWPKGTKPKRLRGTSAILGCAFVNSWRYASAVTGNYLFLWDTERGIELSKHKLSFKMGKGDQPSLYAGNFKKDSYLVVEYDGDKDVFKLEVDKSR